MSPAPSRRLLPALVASLALHGLLWLGVDRVPEGALRGPRAPQPPRPALEWVEVEVRSPPAPPPVPPSTPSEDRRGDDGDAIANARAPLPNASIGGARSGDSGAAPRRSETSPPRPDKTARAPEAPPADSDRTDGAVARATPAPKEGIVRAAPQRDANTLTADAPRPDTAGALSAQPRDDSPSGELADTRAITNRPPPADAPLMAQAPSENTQSAESSDVPRQAPHGDIPRAAPTDARREGARLLLAARTQRVSAWRSEEQAPQERELRGAREPTSPQALVEELVAEGVGRGKVDRGLVHPYFSQLGKTLLGLWDADRAVKEHGLQGYFDMGMERSRAYGRVWGERAANYGATGAFAANKPLEEDRRRPASQVGDPTLRMRQELREKMREEFRATRRALIRVVQDPQGRLLDVELVEPSHQPEVDNEAMKDVRAAAQKLPPPPAEAVGKRERITSLWEFELILSISPPIPIFTFEFDEALGFIDTRLPLDKRIYKRVRLVELR
nr:TonB C-terminal domain-containing protein [Myxococcus sp. MH1]